MSDREIINRLALEDRDAKYMTEEVAPLVAKLVEGKNYVNARQFADLVAWFEDELEDVDESMALGRFELFTAVQVIRVKPPGELTASDIAKKTGIPVRTVSHLLAKTGLTPRVQGKRKYYDVKDLAPFLRSIGKGT